MSEPEIQQSDPDRARAIKETAALAKYEEAPKRIEVTLRKKSFVFFLHDISAAQSIEIFEPMFNGGEIESREAKREQRCRVVSAVVRQEDGTQFTFEQCLNNLPALLVARLFYEAMKYVNGVDDEDEAKKASDPEAASTSGTS